MKWAIFANLGGTADEVKTSYPSFSQDGWGFFIGTKRRDDS